MVQTTSVSSSSPRALRSLQQRGGRLIEDRRVDVVLRLERLVAVPVADALAHRVGAVEELHEAHAALEQPPGEQAVAGEAGLDLVGVVGAVGRVRGGRLARQVADFRRAELQLRGQLVAGDPRGQLAVAGIARQVLVVEQLEKVARGSARPRR